MRIVGGRFKGRRLAPVKGLHTRPTSDRVREAVFNILPRDFPFRTVLDLFAGTGAMGLEALSRGAEEATFVDSDAAAVSVIRKNLELCGEEARVIRKDAPSALKEFARKGEQFDLIIIDPPYSSDLAFQALKAIDQGGILSPGGVIVAEAAKRAPLEAEFSGLEAFDERRYGDTMVCFYRHREGLDA